MKGNLVFKVEIKKKVALGLLFALSAFATADYVSMIDVKSSGGIVIEKETMDVGSVVFRMDSKNPSTIYGGVWELITGDANITLGDGSDLNGLISGINDPVVPLPQHSHTIDHNHPSATTNTDTHSHTQYVGQSGSGSSSRSGWNITGSFNRQSSFGQTSTDSHNHTVDLPNFSGNSGNAGVSDAKVDVRGARLALNVWKRVS